MNTDSGTALISSARNSRGWGTSASSALAQSSILTDKQAKDAPVVLLAEPFRCADVPTKACDAVLRVMLTAFYLARWAVLHRGVPFVPGVEMLP